MASWSSLIGQLAMPEIDVENGRVDPATAVERFDGAPDAGPRTHHLGARAHQAGLDLRSDQVVILDDENPAVRKVGMVSFHGAPHAYRSSGISIRHFTPSDPIT